MRRPRGDKEKDTQLHNEWQQNRIIEGKHQGFELLLLGSIVDILFVDGEGDVVKVKIVGTAPMASPEGGGLDAERDAVVGDGGEVAVEALDGGLDDLCLGALLAFHDKVYDDPEDGDEHNAQPGEERADERGVSDEADERHDERRGQQTDGDPETDAGDENALGAAQFGVQRGENAVEIVQSQLKNGGQNAVLDAFEKDQT